MKNVILIILVILCVIFGMLLSLIALYASPDEKVHFLEASYIWIGNSIIIFGLLYYIKSAR